MKAGLIDSVGVLELVTFLESAFSIEVKDENMLPSDFDTIGGIVAFVGCKLAIPGNEVGAHAR